MHVSLYSALMYLMDLDFKTVNIITAVLSLALTSLNKALVNIAAVRSEHRQTVVMCQLRWKSVQGGMERPRGTRKTGECPP